MSNEYWMPVINDLLSNTPAEKLAQAVKTIADLQKNLCALFTNEDSAQLDLLKIGTVFQIFLIDTLADGKNPLEVTPDEWKNIAEKVSQYAVFESEQSYSEFVFSLYANYIDISANKYQKTISEKSYSAITEISDSIRTHTEYFRNEEITESAYIETCLWLSLEAMIKLLSASLTSCLGPEYSELAQAVTQLAFEYGRYVLYAKEQAILEKYLQNQYALDEQLKKEYDVYLAEVQAQADQFQILIDNAFSSNIQEALMHSADLARAAGVKEEEILTSVEDVDDFFM